MKLARSLSVGLASLATVTAAVVSRCAESIVWDGRVPEEFALEEFDGDGSMFNAEYVLGAGQKWSEVLKFPEVEGSLFDLATNSKAIEVTVNDSSIFTPSTAQPGFRRSELLPSTNNGTDATVQGATAHHFSLRVDPARPLNYSHEYQLVFIETNDYSSHVFTLKTGTAYGTNGTAANAETFRLGSSTADGDEEVLWSVDVGEEWHNWAVENNWDNNTIAVYYSSGYNALEKVVETRTNENSGKGQAHFGILKLPTGASSDVSKEGFQESGIDEGVILGGIFVEDSKGGVTRGS